MSCACTVDPVPNGTSATRRHVHICSGAWDTRLTDEIATCCGGTSRRPRLVQRPTRAYARDVDGRRQQATTLRDEPARRFSAARSAVNTQSGETGKALARPVARGRSGASEDPSWVGTLRRRRRQEGSGTYPSLCRLSEAVKSPRARSLRLVTSSRAILLPAERPG